MNRLKHFSVIFFPFLFAILVVTALIYRGEVRAERLSLETKAQYIVDMTTESIQEDLEKVGNDISYLVEDYERLSDDGGFAGGEGNAVVREYRRFAETRKMYNRISVIDPSGKETLRVKYAGGDPVIMVGGDIASEEENTFSGTSSMNGGQLFISPIDADLKNGKIMYPLNPVIRFVSPLFPSSDNGNKGSVVLSYSGRYLLNRIRKIKNRSYEATGLPGYLMISSENSYWIMSDNPQDEWSFVPVKDKENTFQNEYPEIWDDISAMDSGTLNLKDGIFVFDTVTLSSGTKWKVIFFITAKKIKELLFSKWVYFLSLTGFFLVILLIVSLFMANSNIKREIAEKEMERMARTDPLTTLYNRRSFLEQFEYERARSERYGGDISVTLCDIDFFKKINDEYGHDAGDYVLKTVAGILKSKVRKQDIVCRWGGEEFILIFPETTVKKAAVGVERLRKLIEKYEFRYEGDQIKVTMSFGIAQHSLDVTIDDCIKKADEFLYLSKKKGRNMISFSDM